MSPTATAADHAALARIEQLLQEFFARQRTRHAGEDDAFRHLWDRVERLARGGKRVRPRLVLAAHEHLGGSDETAAESAALAFELVHTALLVHDDIIDGDVHRRGIPNVTGSFQIAGRDRGLDERRSRAWGEATALLAGDLLLSAALRELALMEAPAPVRRSVIDLMEEALAQAVAGEQADVAFSLGLREGSEQEIRRMMVQKTAGYSFDAPLRAGALIAQAPSTTLDALGRIGEGLGLLFQMRDDLLGVFGDPEDTGKSASGDLRTGKRTLLIAYAQQSPIWDQTSELWGRADLSDGEVGRLRETIVASGARARLEAETDRVAHDVFAAIQQARLPVPLAGILTAETDRGRNRRS